MLAFWHLVEETEPANYTWTFDIARQASGAILAYSGASIFVPPNNSSSSTTTAGTSFAGTGTNSTYETGAGLQFFASRNTTGASSQTANVAYTKREDTCSTASVFVGLAGQDQPKGLSLGSTTGTGNTCTVSSTAVGISLFLEDARPAFVPPGVDGYSVNSIAASANNMTTPAFQTNVPNVTPILVVSINKDTGITVSSIATPGLNWVFVSRVNTNVGCVELWRSFAPTPLSPQTTTINFSGSVVSANVMIAGFINADYSGTDGSNAIGSVTTGTFTGAVPTLNLTTTRSNSWVWAAINSSNTTSTFTAGSSQQSIRTQTDSTNTTQAGVWRRTAYTPTSGTTVTMNLTSPSAGTGNVMAFEILPTTTHGLGAMGAG